MDAAIADAISQLQGEALHQFLVDYNINNFFYCIDSNLVFLLAIIYVCYNTTKRMQTMVLIQADISSKKAAVESELKMGNSIQISMLPHNFPSSESVEIFATMDPAKEVGGDFYDFFFIDKTHVGIVVADVSGKGVPAALFMMMSKNIIHNLASMGLSPKEVMESANRTICANNKQRMFVTVWLGILEISTGRVTAVNAGHEIPMICQPGGEFELFEEPHGVMVGVFSKAEYEQYEFTLKKGSSLFVYTDGVAEATNASDEMFRTDRLLTALNEHKGGTQKQLLESVQREVERFAGDAEQSDDLTMLGITIH